MKSEVSHAALDARSRLRKADKIVAVLQQRGVDLRSARLLDIGTGSGFVPHVLSRHAQQVVSVDLHDERVRRQGYRFQPVSDERLPFDDRAFDAVVSNQVIEHVPDQQRHIDEIYRVLRPGGVAYLATPNRYWLIEPHHRLPLLSWLPRPLADAYLRAVRGRGWDIYPLSFSEVHGLVEGRLVAEDMLSRILDDPTAYRLDVAAALHRFLRVLPDGLVDRLSVVAPSFIFLLHKPETPRGGR